jgi:hypothetical protein
MFVMAFAGFFVCMSLVLLLALVWIERERRRHSGRASMWRGAYFQHVRATERTVDRLRSETADLRNKLADAIAVAGDATERLKREEAS